MTSRDAYTEQERELIARRICPCSPACRQSVAGRRQSTIYVDAAHRQRHYRNRVKTAATAAGLPAVLTLKTVQGSTPTKKRHGDAPRARKSGQSIRISYRKAVDAVAEHLSSYETAHEVLDPLLTDRQKEALRHAA